MGKFLSQSKDMSHEYCCTRVIIGEIRPIEGKDFIGVTTVEGRDIVIRKDQVKEGDILFYVSNESQLNKDFLGFNNLFDDYTLNANYDEIIVMLNTFDDKIAKCDPSAEDDIKALQKEKEAYLNSHKGYFNKHGRVRMIKLGGVMSMGYLFSEAELKTWCPNLIIDTEIGEDFDTVNGELFVQAYVPPVNESRQSSRSSKSEKKLKTYDRMIPGQFAFHYDTSQLERNIHRLHPDDNITVSIKLHGTSFIMGNILVKKPKWHGLYEKVFLYLPKFLQFTKNGYDDVYSSRRVIQNAYINTKKGEGYSKGLNKTFKKYYELLQGLIPHGMTIYGEIIGFEEESNTYIQKMVGGYDYRCKPGKNQLMIYRITTMQEDGTKREWNVQEIYDWTVAFKNLYMTSPEHQEIAERLRPIDILYQGKAKDMYDGIDPEKHWQEEFLNAMKNDTKIIGMELAEPLCRNRVPREGIVLRINDDVIPEAFKLKAMSFLKKESDDVDKGNIDAEMAERY